MKALLLALAILVSVALVGNVAAQQSSDDSTTMKKKTDVKMQKKPAPNVQRPAATQAPAANKSNPVINPAQRSGASRGMDNNMGTPPPSPMPVKPETSAPPPSSPSPPPPDPERARSSGQRAR